MPGGEDVTKVLDKGGGEPGEGGGLLMAHQGYRPQTNSLLISDKPVLDGEYLAVYLFQFNTVVTNIATRKDSQLFQHW